MAATDCDRNSSTAPARMRRGLCLPVTALALALASPWSEAAVLAEDRADALYHSYDGGGVQVSGPSILVRKGDDKSFSGTVNYYVDSISSASIDVLTQGSPYSEQRTQWSGSIDYLHADTTMSAGYTLSDESDYLANTFSFSVSQSMFGDLTTVSIGYSRGFDEISSNVDDTLDESADHQNYHVSLSQILTKDLLLSINYDAVTDEGFLRNPYRRVYVLDDFTDPDSLANFNTPERYPNTRTSNAVSANFIYYLPYRAAVQFGYRYYADDWDISAHTLNLGYTHPFGSRWLLDLGLRYYQQTAADFYADLFERPDQQNFVARDKELSEFKNYTAGFGVTYELLKNPYKFIDRATLNLRYDRIWFKYDNYSDVRNNALPPEAPLYEFEADVLQFFASIWY